MLVVFLILVVVASVILGLLVLIQNPKGGGLSGSFGGFSNQFMGVKQTTDVLEKGTWLFAGIVGILCLLSPVFLPKGGEKTILDSAPTTSPTKVVPLNTIPNNQAPGKDTSKP
ncbi:MAG: preprotein translocase subunit SecG [Ferruginibacter sp.]